MGASQCVCCDSISGETVDNISGAVQLEAVDNECKPAKRARPSLKKSVSLPADDSLASDRKTQECPRRQVSFVTGEAKLEICFYKKGIAAQKPVTAFGRSQQEQRYHPLYRNVTFAELRKCSGFAGAALTECWSELGPAYVKEEEVRVVFLKAPLGVEFADDFPMKVKSVTCGSFADAQGLKVGWEVKSIAGKALAAHLNSGLPPASKREDDLKEQECERSTEMDPLSSMLTQAQEKLPEELEDSAASRTRNSCGSIGVENADGASPDQAAEPIPFSAGHVPTRRQPDLWNLKEAMDFLALEVDKMPRDDVKDSLRSSLGRL